MGVHVCVSRPQSEWHSSCGWLLQSTAGSCLHFYNRFLNLRVEVHFQPVICNLAGSRPTWPFGVWLPDSHYTLATLPGSEREICPAGLHPRLSDRVLSVTFRRADLGNGLLEHSSWVWWSKTSNAGL